MNGADSKTVLSGPEAGCLFYMCGEKLMVQGDMPRSMLDTLTYSWRGLNAAASAGLDTPGDPVSIKELHYDERASTFLLVCSGWCITKTEWAHSERGDIGAELFQLIVSATRYLTNANRDRVQRQRKAFGALMEIAATRGWKRVDVAALLGVNIRTLDSLREGSTPFHLFGDSGRRLVEAMETRGYLPEAVVDSFRFLASTYIFSWT